MRKRVMLSLLLLSASLAPAAPAWAKTTVTVEGTVVTIRVPIDLVSPVPPGHESEAAAFLHEEEQAVEEIWNAGFDAHPYQGCFTLRLDVELNRVDGRGDARSGHHVVSAQLPSGRPTFAGMVIDPAADDAHEDTTGAYDADLQGVFNIEWMSDRTWAHEVGHLLGLGDDYDDSEDGTYEGREPSSIMGKGDEVTAGLVERIGGLVEGSGVALPQCWTGTMRSAATDDGRLGGLGCVSREQVVTELRLVVTAEGDVSGEGHATSQTGNADFRCTTGQVGPSPGTDLDLVVEGRLGSDGFELRFSGGGGGGCGVGFCPANFQTEGGGPPPVQTVPLVGDDTARGRVRVAWGTYGSTNSFELKCLTCGEP